MMQRIRGMKEQKGFTLIELLIVIVILGILAAIVVFAVGGITDRGKKSACKSDLKNVEVAQEARRASTVAAYAPDVATLVAEKYLREAPSSADYTITTDTSGVVVASPASCNGL